MTDAPARRDLVDKRGDRVSIVPYDERQYDHVVEMYRDYPTEHRSHGLPPVLEDELHEWLAELEARGRTFVGLLDDEVVGHAAYTPLDAPRPDFVVFVDPDYQGRGIGTELVDHVVQNIAAEGFDGAVSFVDRDNESAIHVYEKIGFEDVERDRLVVRMRLDLTEPESGDGHDFGEYSGE